MSSSSGEDSGSREIEICRIQSPDRREDKEECVNHEQDKKVFNIAQEIMTSERDYVESLCLINVDFKDFLDAARSETKSDIIPEKDLSRIFSNLLELQMLNVDLLRDFESRVENWSTCPMIADVIVRKGDFLKLYTSYVQDFQQTSEAFICCCDRYPAFGRLVEDFEALDKCRKLKVTHFMLKPVQRLPQYKLLLEEYSKNLSPSSQDFSNAVEALAIVKKAADHVNRKMKQNDNFKRLLSLQSRLGGYGLVQANRELIREGEILKISRNTVDQRYLILCNDCLIYAKHASSALSEGSLKVSYKIPLANLTVDVPNAEEYPQDFNIRSPVRSCTLRADSATNRERWVSALNQAIAEHLSRRATFAKAAIAATVTAKPTPSRPSSRLQDDQQQQRQSSEQQQPRLGDSAPVWIPDERVTMCQSCHSDFTLLLRRHHCRACGLVFCYLCSGNRAPLKYSAYEQSRVCDCCFEDLRKMLPNDNKLQMFKHKFRRSNHPRKAGRSIPSRLQVGANDEGAQMSGYLQQQKVGAGAGSSSKWKKFWFVLKDRVLYEYRASEDKVAAQTYPILGFDLDVDVEAPIDLLQQFPDGQPFRLTHLGSSPLVFFAESELLSEKWTQALLEAIKF